MKESSYRLTTRIRKVRFDLNRVHFCKSSKAKYRLHITAGVLAASSLATVGIITGHDGLTHFATVANLVTCVMWIWE